MPIPQSQLGPLTPGNDFLEAKIYVKRFLGHRKRNSVMQLQMLTSYSTWKKHTSFGSAKLTHEPQKDTRDEMAGITIQ